ncbi:neuferricin homolog [Uranotaenia lowii]|uniref:neuferricin homolog n=1 Tax=Uranotaenia lowii TaxID=190385 RepID=UPI00247A0B56|nr:neuferricin homolog [Uranotaenia lowii]
MVTSYLAPYYRHIIVIGLAASLFVILSRDPPAQEASGSEKSDSDESPSGQGLFTDTELAAYDGTEGSKGLYLVILGHVYDVASGAKHYGPGEAYSMFVGHDASRSFISGDFEEYTPDMADVSPLTDSELKSIVKWKSFYDETYPYRGKLMGRHFDANGEPTEYHKLILERVARAAEEEAQGTKQEYPSCNVEWKQETGSRFWCSSRSGDGIERGWVGKPRQYRESKADGPVCVCVPDGDENKAVQPFAGCEVDSESCFVKDEEKSSR